MAYLTAEEFTRAVALLAAEHGLASLRDRLVRLNAFVSRRRVASAERLADQLYLLSGGLRRNVPATAAFQHLWTEFIRSHVNEEQEKALETLADKINECLDADGTLRPDAEETLATSLREYSERLAQLVGEDAAYLDMLLKAVPSVAERLRAGLHRPAPGPAAGGGEPDS